MNIRTTNTLKIITAASAASAVALAGIAPHTAAQSQYGGKSKPQKQSQKTSGMQKQNWSDRDVAEAIEDEMLLDPAVPAHDLAVNVVDGVATLSGETNNLLVKRRSERIAETVRGVRSVINRVSVAPTVTITDAELRENVSDELLRDPATESYEVEVGASGGVVTLTGTVDSVQEKQLAARVAASVEGVVEIRNNIDVDLKTDRPAYEIENEVEQALRWNTLVDDALISVEAANGVVTLSGIVGSAAERSEAVAVARVAGVNSVDASELTVARWARDEDLRAEKYTDLSESETRQAIIDAFAVSPRVAAFGVKPEVDGDIVTLRGEVDNLKAKNRADEIARNTVGVRRVKNRIKVEPDQPIEDEAVARNVRGRIRRNLFVDERDVTVNVDDGVATLKGEVNTYFEKSRADEAAALAEGVVDIRNRLSVDDRMNPYQYDPYVGDWVDYDATWYDYDPMFSFKPDEEIREDINDELFWSPFVDSDEVRVTVDDGVATLRGTVDSFSEYNTARENAFEGGATWVINNLEVEAS